MKVSRRKFLHVAGVGGAAVAGVGCDSRFPLLWPFNQASPGPTAAFTPPATAEIDPITHHLNRLTFGVAPGDYGRIAALDPDPEKAAAVFVDEQLDADVIDDRDGDRATRGYEYQYLSAAEHFNFNKDSLLYEMLRYTVARAVYSHRQLREVMVQFWSDHFNIDSSKADCRWLKASDDREVIRKHALGSFPEMVRASARSPAMLWYLDGRVNRRATEAEKPNENYGRELLELHTLGVHGGYTQKDVMEVARALSGWTTPARDELFLGTGLATVKFKPENHDDGEKVILGRHIPAGLGKKEIDRVLDIVCHHPSTATHIADKLCRRFIADEPPASAVARVAKAFSDSQGDIKSTLRAIFASDEFRMTRGNKIKRPFNFVVSCLRATHAKTDASTALLQYLHRMGHAPFHFPTPDGYPEEPTPWLATLLWRWNFSRQLSRGTIEGTKIDPDQLSAAAGGQDSLVRHFLGRLPTDAEAASHARCGADSLALLMASPAFQTC